MPLRLDPISYCISCERPQRCSDIVRRQLRRRALDEAAAEHARCPDAAVVEHAGLAGRDALLARDAVRPRSRPRRSRRHAGCGGRVERTRTNISMPSPTPRRARRRRSSSRRAARCGPSRSASRGPTTTRRLRRHRAARQTAVAAGSDAEALALADGEMDDAVVAAEHAAGEVDDLAGLARIGPQLADDVGVVAVGTKQMSWLSGLSATARPKRRRARAPRACSCRRAESAG